MDEWFALAVIDSASEAIATMDPHGTILSWNDTATRMYGFTADEAVGQNICMVIPPEKLNEEREIRARLLRGERIDHYETIRRRSDGSTIEVSVSISPVRDAVGQVVATAGFARDISDQRRMQQLLAAFVQSSDDAIVSKDLDHGTILSWNDAATRMYGFTADEAVGQNISLVVPADRLDEEEQINARLARGERIDHYETVRRRSDGSTIEVSISISPVRDASGRVVAAAGFARDITEQKRYETRQLLAAFVDSSDDAIVSKNLDGTILSWNDAATRMYGFTAEEAVGRNISLVIPAEKLGEEREIRARLARGERIDHYVTVRRHRDRPEPIEVSLSISPVRDASGQVVAAAGFARDITEQKRMEVHRQQLAAIVESSDDAIVSKDLDGTILSWNDAATRMYGFTAEEAVGRNISLVIPAEKLDEEQEIRARLARGERIDHYETARRRSDGSTIQVSVSISPVRDASGQVVAAAGFARDISEQKRMEQLLAAFVQSSDDAIVSKDLDGTILSWNDAATRMYGFTADEAVGQNISLVIPAEKLDEEQEIRARLARGERVDHYETVRRHKDRPDPIEVSLSISPVRDASGKVVAAAGFARDITEQKRYETRQHLAAIVESSDDAIVSTDLHGTILSWNDAATRMYGFTAEEAKGQNISIVSAPEQSDEERGIWGRLARGERIEHLQTMRRRKNKPEPFEVSLSISPVRDASGQFVAAASIARDITEQRRRDAFQQGFVRFVAHDIKSPLVSASQTVERVLATEAADLAPTARDRLAGVVRLLHWIYERTGSFENFAAPTTRFSLVNVEEVFDETVEMLRSIQDRKRAWTDATITRGNLPLVFSDKSLLSLLFQNLIENAVKFTDGLAHVTVSAECDGDLAHFTFRDRGLGIPAAMLHTIFQAYSRADTRAPGTGVGLAICKTIVERHPGGAISAVSPEEGGAEIHFTLPLRQG